MLHWTCTALKAIARCAKVISHILWRVNNTFFWHIGLLIPRCYFIDVDVSKFRTNIKVKIFASAISGGVPQYKSVYTLSRDPTRLLSVICTGTELKFRFKNLCAQPILKVKFSELSTQFISITSTIHVLIVPSDRKCCVDNSENLIFKIGCAVYTNYHYHQWW